MKELYKEISELKENVSDMVELIHELRKTDLQQKSEIGNLNSEIENQKQKINFLEEKNKMVNLASTIEPGERNEMKLKIKELVREIDGCIALIKN